MATSHVLASTTSTRARRRASLAAAFGCLLVSQAAGCRDGETGSISSAVLGTATSFAVLAGSTVTNTGPSIVSGDLGLAPGSAVTGFPPGIVLGGVIHAADAVALQAQADLTTAYDTLAGQACDTDLTGQDLGGLTLVPGVYCFASSAQLTGVLTLDAQGDADAMFVFQIGSTLNTASSASVLVVNGASSCNAFFQVGSSATLGTATTFNGNILALTSISLATGATVSGRTLARNGAVTLDLNQIDANQCATGESVDAGVDAGAPMIDAAPPPPIDAPACPQDVCGAFCVDLDTDNYNCGTCGNVCPGTQRCTQRTCVAP